MSSKIYEQFFERHLQQFVGIFSEDSSVIFKDEKNKLIHPGEYGRYREDACKQLLRLLLDKSVSISDGFIITSNNNITTQCDIVIYNSAVAPIVADGFTRMFPAEEVRMIGEVKSTLSRSDFINALRKMSESKKKILDGRSGTYHFQPNKETETYDTIASFLICNKLSFDAESITYEDIYEGIDKKYWHNIILSIENVTMTYALNFNDFSPIIKEHLDKNGVNINFNSLYPYPKYVQKNEIVSTHPRYIKINPNNKYEHIKLFCVGIAACCQSVWIYTFDPIEYLGLSNPLFYKEN